MKEAVMSKKLSILTCFTVSVLAFMFVPGSEGASLDGGASPAAATLTPEQKKLLAEHVYKGLPGKDNVHVRQAYVISYNPDTRTPNWVAYHIDKDYRNTPSRKGWASSFRSDPDIANEAKDSEYLGLFASDDFARGHMAPFGIMGGDRNDDGEYAEYHQGNSGDKGDPYDAKTVMQGNYMSNIAPQQHSGFNGWDDSGPGRVFGLWFELERWIQDTLVSNDTEVWVIAGCIFGKGEHKKVGPQKDIVVPAMFYKIVVWEEEGFDKPVILAYLLPHQKVRHGDLDSFLVSVDVIEALAGVDFFNELDDDVEEELEGVDTWVNAKEWFE